MSVGYALRGLAHAYRADESFRLEINWGLPIYLIIAWCLAPFQEWELLVFIFSYLLVLIVELINTAFETMLDRLHPEQHDLIARSKDVSASAVLMAFLFAIVVVAVLAVSRIPHEIPAAITRPFV